MKAVVFHGVGDIRWDDAPDPQIEQPTDAIVRLTSSAICGTDLHMVRGTMPGMKPGTILGHEGVGIVEEVGKGVRNLKRGDRVVIPVRLEPGQTCRTQYRGSSWTARNVDQQAIDAGKEAVISHVDGLTLHVRAA